jgi:aminomethyltransferase
VSENELLKSALHAKHVSAEAKMAEEAGWDIPLSYGDPLAEVRQARSRVGVCDVSHIGRIRVRGDGAPELLERACTADVTRQEDDTALYTLLCNERGGVIDQAFVLRLPDFWVLTCSPICREKVLRHLQALAADFDAKVDDQTEKTSQIALTGPAAAEVLDKVLPMKVSQLPPLAARTGSVMFARYIAMRTSYSGQWSIEVILANMMAGQAWRFITQKAGENCMPPIGLAARDVLRIEAGLARYGHELNETIDPIAAGLEKSVDFAHDFLGREALQAAKACAATRKLVGLVLQEAGAGQANIPRQGTAVSDKDGREVGAITSGTYSPTLKRAIAMAYVALSAAGLGQELTIGQAGASVVEPPFV